MKKEIIRRETIRLKLQNKSNKEIVNTIKERFDYDLTRMTIYRWMKRINETEWDLRDISQRPHIIHYKFTAEEKALAVNYRKKEGYSSQKLRIKLREKELFMSESTIKGIVKGHGLSNGNKMEGILFIRF